jgi:lysyl-tRNA synthetase class 2
VIAAPSDLAGIADGVDVVVGGRVLRAGSQLLLADAWVSVPLITSVDLEDGSLVVVAGGVRAGALHVQRCLRAVGGAPNRDVARISRVGEALRLRARALETARATFRRRGFVEVETPTIVPSPGLDTHLDAFDVGHGSFLATSPEYQMKRLLVGGVPRCFQLGRAYRREEQGARHNPEFTMLEWYRAFGTMEDVMHDTEELVREVVVACSSDPATLQALAPEEPFERLRVAEAFERFASIPLEETLRLATEDEERFFEILAFTVEPALAEQGRPVFLTHYPRPMASLAALDPSDVRFALRFELYAQGVELCNGFDELTDPVEQRARFESDRALRAERGRPVYPIDERFLESLREGMPPSAGNALGFDRLVMLALGRRELADVLAFPFGEL